MDTNETYSLTPKDAAQMLGVPYKKVLGFISTGDLRAIDTSNKPGVGRPRWRVSPLAVADFTTSRSNKPTLDPAPKPQASQPHHRRSLRRSIPRHI